MSERVPPVTGRAAKPYAEIQVGRFVWFPELRPQKMQRCALRPSPILGRALLERSDVPNNPGSPSVFS